MIESGLNAQLRDFLKSTAFGIILACVVVVLSYLYLFPMQADQTSITAFQVKPQNEADNWPTTVTFHFTVKCPVVMLRGASTSYDVANYQGIADGSVFGITSGYLPGRSDTAYDEELKIMEDGFKGRYVPLGFQVDSERAVHVNGYTEHELSFSGSEASKVRTGTVRFVAHNGSIVMIWVVYSPDVFSPDKAEKYLSSLQIR